MKLMIQVQIIGEADFISLCVNVLRKSFIHWFFPQLDSVVLARQPIYKKENPKFKTIIVYLKIDFLVEGF